MISGVQARTKFIILLREGDQTWHQSNNAVQPFGRAFGVSYTLRKDEGKVEGAQANAQGRL